VYAWKLRQRVLAWLAVAGTIADITATEPSFTVERFEPVGERLEVAGHWSGLRGRRFVRPVLWLHNGESRRRLVAVLDHKPWAVEEGDAWIAAFAWKGGKLDADRAELELGTDLIVELPVPGSKRSAAPRPAQARKPTELERVREQLAVETKERRELQQALDGVEREADTLARVRGERDAGREEADRARADGERLVNDEYRQRERAQQAADEAGQARDLAQRQLVAARESYAALEQRAAAATAEAVAARERLATEIETLRAELAAKDEAVAGRDTALAAHDRLVAEIEALREELAAANEDRDRLRSEIAAPVEPPPVAPAQGERLEAELIAARDDRERFEAELAAARAAHERVERELAGAWAQNERIAAELEHAREGRERVEAELVAVRGERKRLEREVADRERAEPHRRPVSRRAPAPAAQPSRIAEPRSGPALWTVRLVALGLVLLLLIAIALVVGRIA
jgi:chromosome segregation ATPase